MAAMTGLEFQDAVLSVDQDGVPLYTKEEFSVVAAAILAQISIAPENYDKDLIVEVIQKLAIKMPTELVMAGTLHTMTVIDRVHSELTD